MKFFRVIQIFLCVSLVLAIFFGIGVVKESIYAQSPIAIYTLQDLDNVRNNLSSSYVLMNNLDFNSDSSYDQTDPNWATKKASWTTGEGWDPIGQYPNRFTGTFDGQENTISNLYINRPTEDKSIGLFGGTNGNFNPVFIMNLNLVNIDVTGGGDEYVGGLIGHNYLGTVSNCHVTGAVVGSAFSVGGFIGYNEAGETGIEDTEGGYIMAGYIENTSFSGSVSGINYVGGLIGFQGGYETSVIRSSSSGTVTGEYAVGGLMGSAAYILIEDCHSTSLVNGIGDSCSMVGGLIGQDYGYNTIRNSYALGDVVAPTCEEVGGLIGNNDSDVENSYATGDVSGLTNVGGLIGLGWSSVRINNSYSTGSVIGSSNVGGFIGRGNKVKISNSYSTGSIIGSTYIGGFIGLGSDLMVLTNSFWNTESSGMATSPAATGKTTSEMLNISNYNNTSTEGLDTAWDIAEYSLFTPPNSNIWFMEDTYGYPHLFYEYDEYIPLATEGTEPTVSTATASEITSIAGKLNANLTEVGTYGTPLVYFQHREIGGDWNGTAPISKDVVGTYSYNLTNLTPSTTYEFRAAVNFDDSSTNYGSIFSFTTQATNTAGMTLSEIRITNIGLIGDIPNLNFLLYHFTSTTVRIKGLTFLNSNIIFKTDDEEYTTRSNEDGYFELVMQLTERTYEFDYYTYDNLGNKSKVKGLTLIIDPDYLEDGEEEEVIEDIPPVEDQDDDVPVEDIPPVTQTPEETDKVFGERIFDFIKGLSITEKQSKDIATRSLISLPLLTILSLAFGNTHIWALLIRVFSYILALFKIGKKKRNCGLVYNSVTKEPLGNAIVRIFSKDGRLVATEVTNPYGIFESSLPSDTYKLNVNMNGYVFPSSLISGSQDLPYKNIYIGGDFNLINHPINYSVPVDPINKSVLQGIKTVVQNRLVNISIFLINIVIVIGLLFSIISYIKVSNTFNLSMLILYILTLLIAVIVSSRGKYRFGTVRDINEERLKGLELSLLESEFGTNFAKRITDAKGKYRFIVPGGEYKLVSIDPNYNILLDSESVFKGEKDKVMVISNNLKARKR